MWSGSVTPGGETQDNYNGAGLEIHDGNTGTDESFFKFRTNDADNNNSSSFDIKTSRFFLGQEDSTFVSGALGNFIDRLPDGIVTDFLHLKPFDFSLFIFNFADAYITVGAIIFIFSELILLKSKNES